MRGELAKGFTPPVLVAGGFSNHKREKRWLQKMIDRTLVGGDFIRRSKNHRVPLLACPAVNAASTPVAVKTRNHTSPASRCKLETCLQRPLFPGSFSASIHTAGRASSGTRRQGIRPRARDTVRCGFRQPGVGSRFPAHVFLSLLCVMGNDSRPRLVTNFTRNRCGEWPKHDSLFLIICSV